MTKEDEAYLASIKNWLVQQRMSIKENDMLNRQADELIKLYNEFKSLRNKQSEFILKQIRLAENQLKEWRKEREQI